MENTTSAANLSEEFDSGMLNGVTDIDLGEGFVLNGCLTGPSDPYLSIKDIGRAFIALSSAPAWFDRLSACDTGLLLISAVGALALRCCKQG